MKTQLVKGDKKNLKVLKNEEKQFVIFLSQAGDYQLNIDLAGENSFAEVLGIVLGTKDVVINLHTVQHHLQKNTKSNLLVRSLLFEKSAFSFSGLIRIEKEGNLSDAYQKNESLLLSSQAKSSAKPYLEILARDVRCTHGATLGTVNQDEIFYLTTRGISQDQAVKLIVDGFFQEVLDKISDEKIKKQLTKQLEKNLLNKK